MLRLTRRLCAGLVLASSAVTGAVVTAQSAPILYATGVNVGPGGPGGLYAINPATGNASKLFVLPFWVHQGGLAYDAATDQLYATGYDQHSVDGLWRIDRFTGATSYVGPTGARLNGGGLVIHPNTGAMYATGSTPGSAFYAVDRTTGAATLVSNHPHLTYVYGLGYGPGNVLYGNGWEWTGLTFTTALYTLSDITGVPTRIGFTGAGTTYSGLAYGANGIMYSLGSTSPSTSGLFSMNLTNGQATLIGGTGIEFGALGGLAFAPGQPSSTVPEPSTVLLVSVGLAGVLMGRRRRAAR